MRRSRRDLLSGIGGALVMTLAGCNGAPNTATGDGTKRPTSTVAPSAGSSTPNETQTTTEADDTETPTVEATVPGAWPQCQFDDAKTGFARGHDGPGTEAESAWSVTRDGRINRVPALWDDTLFVGSGEHVVALAASDGTEQWSVDVGDRVTSPATVADGSLYVGVGSDVCALSTADGSEQWRAKVGDEVWAGPTLVDGTVYVGARTQTGKHAGAICAHDAETGSESWRSGTGGSIGYSSPAVHDGTVYVATRYRGLDWARARGYSETQIEKLSPGGYVYAWDAADGTVKWEYAVHDGETEVGVRHSPAVTGDRVIVVDSEGRVHGLSADGEQQWRVDTGGNRAFSAPAVANGAIVVTLYDGTVVSLSSTDGTERWRTTTGEGIQASPVVTEDTVYVSSTDGSIRALDATSGDRQFQVDTESQLAEGEVVVADGTAFLATRDGYDSAEKAQRSSIHAIRDPSE